MCGSSPSGPSMVELAAQEREARSRAQAETDRINAERLAAKEAENAKLLAEQATLATADQARRERNRTLLAGYLAEEPTTQPMAPITPTITPDVVPIDLALENQTTRSSRKARTSRSLIGAF